MKHLPRIAFVALFVIGFQSVASKAADESPRGFRATADEEIVRLGAREVFEQAVTENLRLADDAGAVELESGELFEDDGPAAGHSYRIPENVEVVTTNTWIKKDLIIPNPQTRAAFLVVLSEEPFEAMINGFPQKCGDNLSGRSSSKAYAFDPKILKPGRNEIVLKTSGKVTIARDDEFALGSLTRTRHPNRSAKSTNAGKTWDYDHLGPEGKLDGEYGVRVFLEHYRPKGLLTTPVLDAGNLAGKTVAGPVDRVGRIQIALESEQSESGKIQLRARSGSTYVPREQTWGDWRVLGPTGGTIERPRGRYIQIALEVSTADPLHRPRLKNLTVSASLTRPEDWSSRLRVMEEHNEQIVRTSIPFRYEPLDHPRLKQLRQDFKLDQVVEGAEGELGLLLRLAQWACNYWDWPNHIEKNYPPWDALEILKPAGDGTPVGGFCQQFNLVFLQACESFGFSGRAISISQGRMQEKLPGGGHEVVELWSNEWKKWVYVDGALAWYVVDEKTGTPLSIWELRRRQLQTLANEATPPVRLIDAVRTRNKQFGWQGLGPKPQNWYLEMRLIPRSNFLEQKSPLPLNQGTAEWSWTGSYVWTDSEVPAGFLFGNRVAKRSNFEWTLNQAHYVLEPSAKLGTLRVHLDTETPSFDTYLAEIDDGNQKPVTAVFDWTLHQGRNSLRVRPRNLAGKDGIASWISLVW